MLTPNQIDALSELSQQAMQPVVDFLLDDIARRISEAGQFTSSAAYQIWRAQALGVDRKTIEKELQKRLNVSNSELKKLLKQSAEVGYNFDIDKLGTKAIPFDENDSLQQIVAVAQKLADENFKNITQTLGMVDPYGKTMELTDAYKSCCDYAFNQVVTGATDYNTAIRNACKNLAEKGVRSIDYESGVHTSLEAAVRRNIMGGLGLMQEQISKQNHDAFGADGWEISAHAASAPDHEGIQGKQYSDEDFEALNNSLTRRIGTLNCGHAAFPIILGVNEPQYTPEQLEQFKQNNQKGVTYNGRHYTSYEATQKQRSVERAIRRQKRRVLVAESTGDKDRLLTSQIKLRRLNEEYTRYSKAVGLPTQRERLQVAGFGKKTTSRTVTASRRVDEETIISARKRLNSVDNTVKNDIIYTKKKETVVDGVHSVGKIDIEKYKCVTEDITTDEVIITDTQIAHIKDHHPNDYERYFSYIAEIVKNPDYILEANKPNTAFVLKHIEDNGKNYQIILRLKTSADPKDYKNSVITFLKVEDKRYKRYLRTKKILYKSE